MTDLGYYVYVLRLPTGEPFYVGKGSGPRFTSHEGIANNGEDSERAKIIRAILASGCPLDKQKVASGLSNEAALALERDLIAEYGRRCDGGTLVNIRADDSAKAWMQRMKKISLFVELPMIEKLRSVYASNGLKWSELIRRACDEYLAKQK